jgi:GTP cyclohydrolase I
MAKVKMTKFKMPKSKMLIVKLLTWKSKCRHHYPNISILANVT